VVRIAHASRNRTLAAAGYRGEVESEPFERRGTPAERVFGAALGIALVASIAVPHSGTTQLALSALIVTIALVGELACARGWRGG
jgi:hypothetical protein